MELLHPVWQFLFYLSIGVKLIGEKGLSFENAGW